MKPGRGQLVARVQTDHTFEVDAQRFGTHSTAPGQIAAEEQSCCQIREADQLVAGS